MGRCETMAVIKAFKGTLGWFSFTCIFSVDSFENIREDIHDSWVLSARPAAIPHSIIQAIKLIMSTWRLCKTIVDLLRVSSAIFKKTTTMKGNWCPYLYISCLMPCVNTAVIFLFDKLHTLEPDYCEVRQKVRIGVDFAEGPLKVTVKDWDV